MMLWLPLYLQDAYGMNENTIANVITLYEVGTLIGAIILNYLTDKTEGSKRAPVAIFAVTLSFLLSMSFVVWYDSYPQSLWLVSLFCFGFFTGSIHHLFAITSSGDFGRRHGKRATSTITGIIDGTGTMGYGLIQVFIGGAVEKYGWRLGFLLPVSLSVLLTLAPLSKIYINERRQQEQIKIAKSDT